MLAEPSDARMRKLWRWPPDTLNEALRVDAMGTLTVIHEPLSVRRWSTWLRIPDWGSVNDHATMSRRSVLAAIAATVRPVIRATGADVSRRPLA